MLLRPDWYDPDRQPGYPPRRQPGRFLTALFWACIVFCVLTQLLLF